MIELADIEEVLALFCEGIAGRYLHIKSTREFVSRRLRVASDATVHTRDSIYLPAELDAPHPSAYRVLALEQLGYGECGTYRFSFATARERTPKLAMRGSAYRVEGGPLRQHGDLTRFFSCFARPGLAREIFLLLEQARVRAYVLRTYPGITPHAQRYFKHLMAVRDGFEGSPLERARWALMGADLAAAAGPLASTPKLARAIARLVRPGQDVYVSACHTLSVYRELDPLMTVLAREEVSSPEENLADWLARDQRLDELQKALEDMPLEDVNGVAQAPTGPDELAAVQADADRGPVAHGTARTGGLVSPATRRERDALTGTIDAERSAVDGALGPPRTNARSFRYAEWDYLERRYLKRWCRLFEEKLLPAADPIGAADVESLRQTIRTWRPAVQLALERIRPRGLQRNRALPDGDELDLNAIVEARQDIRAGRSPDERFYSRKERVHRDVCAVFLVDLSASTDDPIHAPIHSQDEPWVGQPGPPPKSISEDSRADLSDRWPGWDDDPWDQEVLPEAPKRKIIDLQREAMLVMAAALDAIGDAYGIYGFSGQGRDCVEIFVAKEPHQAFTNQTLGAIAAMKPKRSTRMGPAIRHATAKLIASGNAIKVLIVLSDGFPQDTDYGPDRGNHEYGVQDSARALIEARQKGVETFCVTVDRSGHDYLKRMCPDARYLVIQAIDDLPGELSKVYAALTAG